MRLVVVGNGMAGSRLVSEVRTRDPHMKITVFGAEACRPYNRILLSNVLAGSSRPEQVRLVDPAWYDAHDVEAAFGSPVAHVDRETRHVVTEDGRREPYDLLVLATGSDALVPPIPGVERAIPFRTLDDCERILGEAERARTAVVIGGGLLGIEAARGLAGRGLPVTLLHLAGHLMERQLDVEAGEVLGETLAGLGVHIRTGVSAAGVEDDGVRLDDGELVEADLVVLACGVRPVTGLAADAGLEVRRGIVVDDELRTDDPSIFAIGECAEHDGTVYGLVAPPPGSRPPWPPRSSPAARRSTAAPAWSPGSRPRASSWRRWARPSSGRSTPRWCASATAPAAPTGSSSSGTAGWSARSCWARATPSAPSPSSSTAAGRCRATAPGCCSPASRRRPWPTARR
ncbi:hypothetical protein GCM10020001_018030 [Nonomuraea salmonea]